ncbi:MAG: multicopper oxidase domain-containing protein, partial [Ardenticatenales bacterium]
MVALLAALLLAGCRPAATRTTGGGEDRAARGATASGTSAAPTDPGDLGDLGRATAAPLPTRVVAAAAGGIDAIVYDPNEMATFPCHGMGTTLMGRCSDEQLATLADIVRAKGGKGIVELPKDGTGAAAAEPTSAAPSPGGETGSATSAAGVRDLGDGIVFDPNAMKDVPCHAMFDIIMGQCTEGEIARLADEARALRKAGGGVKAAAATFLPGDGQRGIARRPQQPTTTLDLADGARFDMAATVITRTIGGRTYPGYGYNDEVGGPILRVAQGSHVTVDFRNEIDLPTTVHWHGLRHANRDDGVPGVTQPAVPPGGRYTYHLAFPDPGVYWYHPHVREDIQQDGGMAGVMLVTPSDPGYFNPVDHEEVLVLDDLFLENGKLVPFDKDRANFTVMGRFGNTMLINGRDDYRYAVRQGDVARFYVVNVANVRPFRLAFDGARMKRVGGDLGKYTEDAYVDSVVIAPAERAIVEVLFDRPGSVAIVNATPERRYTLGTIDVAKALDAAAAARAGGSVARAAFDKRRLNTEIVADMARYLGFAFGEPDIELELDIDMPSLLTTTHRDAAAADGHADEQGGAADGAATAAEHGTGTAGVDHSMEWEDDMLAANRQSTSDETRWVLRDVATGAENNDLAYAFTVGDLVKIRITNRPDSAHPMQHPIHIHGQRFVIVARNGQM